MRHVCIYTPALTRSVLGRPWRLPVTTEHCIYTTPHTQCSGAAVKATSHYWTLMWRGSSTTWEHSSGWSWNTRTRLDLLVNCLLNPSPRSQWSTNMIMVRAKVVRDCYCTIIFTGDHSVTLADAQTVIGFLKTYNLDKDFKVTSRAYKSMQLDQTNSVASDQSTRICISAYYQSGR